jgi:diacylglycerol kinase (ATP)
MKKFVLVYNPLSGNAGFKTRLDEVVDILKQFNAFTIPLRTSQKEDTKEFVLLAREEAADGIIVAGGDGTLHEIINEMLNANVNLPIGIIPSGTCNDFAGHLNIRYDLAECCRLIANGKTRTVDIGKANDQYFLNVASAGLLTSVAHNVEVQHKNTLGKLAYYLEGLGHLPRFRTLKVRIAADGQIIESEIFLFLVMNSCVAGSFPCLAPNAKIDDGKLDLLVINKCRIAELVSLFLRIMSGSHINHRHVIYMQAKDLVIEAAAEVESDLDGELGPRLPLTISTVTNKIRIFSD